MATPRLPDEQLLQLLMKQSEMTTKENIKQILRVNDEQVAINSFKWYNLPAGITGQMIEKMLYYRFDVGMFYIKPLDKFVVLPFVKQNGLDFWGRMTHASPLPFNGSSDGDKNEQNKKNPAHFILSQVVAKVQYDVLTMEDLMNDPDVLTNSCVLLTDYTSQISQYSLSRQRMNEGLIDLESNLIPYMNTALMNSTGVAGMKVGDQSEESTVDIASSQVQKAALTGKKWIAITSPLELQELTGGNVNKAQDFLLAMQSLDNFRLGTHGVDNGGLFEKKAHVNEAEFGVNAGNSSFVMSDRLYNRQHFCDVCNSIWGFGMWVEESETSTGMDMNMDGEVGGNYDEDFDASNAASEDNGGEEQ